MKKKQEKKKLSLIVFIVIIMVGTTFSFVFYGFAPATEAIKYNGLSFESNNNMWIAKINGADAAFSFLPGEVQDIPVSSNVAGMLQQKYEIDITYEVNSTFKESIALAQHQMELTLNTYNLYLRKGFTANNSFNLPIITCKDSSQNVPVIYFRYSNSTNIHLENSCVVAEASKNADFIRVKDRLVYGILGVMG